MATHSPAAAPGGSNSRVHHFKLVLLGDTAVGKSCLVVRFVRDEFFEFQEPTIGGKFFFCSWIHGKQLFNDSETLFPTPRSLSFSVAMLDGSIKAQPVLKPGPRLSSSQVIALASFDLPRCFYLPLSLLFLFRFISRVPHADCPIGRFYGKIRNLVRPFFSARPHGSTTTPRTPRLYCLSPLSSLLHTFRFFFFFFHYFNRIASLFSLAHLSPNKLNDIAPFDGVPQNENGNDNNCNYILWFVRDTAGQERYRSLAPMYYRGASAAIVVYDITNPDSFAGAKSWVKELQRRGDPNVVIALAGNKADLEGRRKVEFEEANAYAAENGILHLETSAKNANNVKALFVEIAKKLPKTQQLPEREAFPIVPQQQEQRNCC